MSISKKLQVRNTLVYLIPPVIAASLPILTLPIFTRVLSPEEFGVFALAQAFGVFISSFINLGLTTAYERNFFEYRTTPKEQARLLYGVLLCVTIVFSLTMLITWFTREQIALLIIGEKKHSELVFWSACSLCVTSFKQYFLLYFRNIEDASSYARYSIDEMILNTVFSIVFVYVNNSGAIGLALGPLLGSLIVFVFLILKFIRLLSPTVTWTPIKDSLTLALPLTPITLFKIFGAQSDKYLVGLMGTVGGVGLYSIGQRFGYLVFIWMTALQNVFSPQVYHKMFTLPATDGSKSIGSYLTPFAYLSAGGGLVIGLFAQEVLILLTTPRFHEACDIVTIFTLVYSIAFWGKIPQLTYSRKTYINTILSFLSNISNFIFCIIGLKLFGMLGAAWGLLAANLFTVPLTIFWGQKSYYIQWETRRLAAIFGYIFVSAFLLIYLRHIGFEVVTLLIFKIISILGYLLIGKKIGIISKENISSLKSNLQFTTILSKCYKQD